MPRRSRNQITKELAIRIVAKLEAQEVSEPGAAHANYVVYHEGREVISFGIRRSSQKNKGHDHIPKELRVEPHFAKQLGQCTKYKEDYLRQIGEIEDSDDAQ
jgi:hypothetical protein